ncbi:hypothetical protein [Homoserinibacter sp. YIM 151385]|uniref:hypothetical protein n=1 Tax=Homoserinibacter sp. YIM 151385 TaxID=2985506 RepID=UPI0022F0B0DA|nr:hypothetical protein [Homoserinibacter sp. YIM 151385]WBU37620.1 hypothetical protein OF852_11970 [Homoserinibacter sp. YIM 151385]
MTDATRPEGPQDSTPTETPSAVPPAPAISEPGAVAPYAGPAISEPPTSAFAGPELPAENVPRGTLLALLAIPAGIIVWTIIWSFGFIASIVAFGVAAVAVWLYRRGSGGRVSVGGAVRVTVITVVTLLLAFIAGLASDLLPLYTSQNGITAVQALTDSTFWTILVRAVTSPSTIGSVGVQLGMALLFGLLGCFGILRGTFRQARESA